LNESTTTPNALPPETTQVLYGNDDVQRKVLEGFSRVKESLDGCIDPTEIYMHVAYDAVWNGFAELRRKGIKLRSITEVTPENIFYVKKTMKIFEVRHLKGIRSNFGIVDRRECLIHSISHEDQPLSHAILTNSKALVGAQQYLFETLWNKAIPAEKKIKEIEEGIVPDFIETLSDKDEINAILHNLINSTMRELLVILPTAHTLLWFEREGVMQLLKEEAKHGIKVRILVQQHSAVSINNNSSTSNEEKIIQDLIKDSLIEIQQLDKLSNTKLIIIVADTKLCLAIEVKNDSYKITSESIGLATHSNSESTVITYTSIFETLWVQAQLRSPITRMG
jgi:two-component system, OmpR family, sensor histidine kinase VicK